MLKVKRVYNVRKNKEEEVIDLKRCVLPEVSGIQTGKLTSLSFIHNIVLSKDSRPVVNATRPVACGLPRQAEGGTRENG